MTRRSQDALETTEHRRGQNQHMTTCRTQNNWSRKDCSGLIEFIESGKTLDDLYGQERSKAMRQVIITKIK